MTRLLRTAGVVFPSRFACGLLAAVIVGCGSPPPAERLSSEQVALFIREHVENEEHGRKPGCLLLRAAIRS